MPATDSGEIIRLETARDALRDYFLGWQCRVRQTAVRQQGGRPNNGMRPSVLIGDEEIAQIVVLIMQREPQQCTAEFRHLFKRTFDPGKRYESALQALGATYYQHPGSFSGEVTALFGPGSAIVAGLLAARQCELVFDHYKQRFEIPSRIRALQAAEPAHKATYWHNSLFNPGIPNDMQILLFTPDWATAKANPGPP